jgi:hypothetical protein
VNNFKESIVPALLISHSNAAIVIKNKFSIEDKFDGKSSWTSLARQIPLEQGSVFF